MRLRGQLDTGVDAQRTSTAPKRAEPGRRRRSRVRSLAARSLTVVLLVAFAAFLARPVQAQTEVTLVSNFTSLGTTLFAVGDISATHTFTQAQKFTTGANADGYTLTSVTFNVGAYEGANITPRVSVYTEANDGNPGSSLYVFTGTITGGGDTTFTAPSNATLVAETSYFVVLEDTNSTTPSHDYRVQLAVDADDVAEMGWSLDERYQQRNAESWTSSATQILGLEIKGTVNGGTTSTDATLSALTVNDGTNDLTLDPAFAPGTYIYAADVANAVDAVTLTATVNDDGAEVSGVTLGGTAIADADFSDGITVPSLVVGDNEIIVTVTVEEAATTLTYTVTVTRAMAVGAQTSHPTVTGLTVSPGASPGELSISWDPHPDGPDDYRVKWAAVGDDYRRHTNLNWNAYPTGTQHTVSGLEPGASHKVQVRARFNEGTNSPWSSEVIGQSADESENQSGQPRESPRGNPSTIKADTPLSAPADFRFEPGDGQFVLSWAAVTADPAVSSYELRHREVDTVNWTETSAGNSLTTTLTGLTNYTTYEVMIAAKNSEGIGPHAGIAEAIPGPVSIVRAMRTGDGGAVKLTFNTPLDTAVTPTASHFSVTVATLVDDVTTTRTEAPARVVHAVGDNRSVTLVLATRMGGDPENVAATVDYSDPDGDDAAGVVQDASGNDALGFTDLVVEFPADQNLVGNVDQPPVTESPTIPRIYNRGQNDFRKVGQGFTTGPKASGYLIFRVKVHLVFAAMGGTSFGGTIHLANADGTPGPVMHDLESVTWDSSRVYVFDAPPGVILEPSTTYIMVVRQLSEIADDDTDVRAGWKLTSGTGESGEAGWSIADQHLLISPPESGGTTFATHVGDIAIDGEDAVRALVPGTPENVMLAGGDHQLVVSWTAPTDGALATSYDLRYRLSTETDWTLKTRGADTSLTDTLTELHNSRSFQVEVRAVSGDYNGAWSDTASGSTTGTVSTDASLTALSLSDVTLSPQFGSTTYSYTGAAENLTASTTVTTSTNSIYEKVEFFLDSATESLDDAYLDEDGHQVILRTGENTLSIKVTAEDGDTVNTYTIAITRAIANAAPTFTSGLATVVSVAENTAANINIGSAFTATDGDNDTITYSLSDTTASSGDAADFTITTSGQIRTKEAIDFEDQASYAVTINVTDGKDAAGNIEANPVVDVSIAVTITVTNVDEPGTVTLPATFTGGTPVTPTLTDIDGTPSSVMWQWARASTATGTFTNISTAHPYTPVAADVGNYLRATASYTDPEGSGKTASATSTNTVAGTNAAPTFDDGTMTTRMVSENTASGVIFATAVAATDPDGDSLTYSLTGTDASSFGIEASDGRLKTSAALNYEVKSSYSVTMNVRDNKDAAGGTDSANDASVAVTITVRNLNEPGTVTITGTPSGGSTLAASVTDPDGGVTNESWQWARDDSAGGMFNDDISGATDNTAYVLVAADVGKYVRARVTYTDGQGTGKSALAVTGQTITASNAVPTFTYGSLTRAVDENSPSGTDVGTAITASDTDSGDTLTYSLATTGDHLSFTIDSSSGQIKTTGVTYNFEATKNSYAVTVNVHDGKDAAGHTETTPVVDASIPVTINLRNVNEAPTVTAGSTTTSFPENSTDAVGTYTASDVDASDTPDTLTWSVEPADDGGLFAITTNSDGEGVLTFAASPDFEDKQDAGTNNVYDVTVKVADGGSLSDTRAVAVTVTNVNEAPEITTIGTTYTAPSFDENGTAVVATYQATDVDDMSTLTWSLEGEDKDFFTITKNSSGDGELEFANPPDYEMPADDADNDSNPPDNVYDIRVKVVDNHSPEGNDTLDVAVTVEDVNETPVVSGDGSPSFAEIEFDVDDADLDAADYVIGTYAASDEENDDIGWSVSGTDMAHFAIGPTTGVLSFNIRPDFENPVDMVSNNTYEIVVEALDNNSEGGKTGVKTGTFAVTVTVTNVNETPEITGGSAAPSFAEIEWDAASADLEVETYTARDEETETVTWSLAGTDAGDFSINPNSGVLSFASRPNYEMPADADTDTTDSVDDAMDNDYAIIVKARDTASNTRDFPVTVTVTNVDETPEITNPPAPVHDFPETPYDSDVTPNVVNTFTARDEEGDDIEWSLTENDAGDFVITKNASGEGVVTFRTADPPEYKRPDFERPEDDDGDNAYVFVVVATDPAGNTATWASSVEVTNVDETPEFTVAPTTTVTYDENETTDVATYTARDEEASTIYWSLTGTDSGDFVIDSVGTVTFVATPDWEAPVDSDMNRIYTFTVVAAEAPVGSSPLTVSADVTVTVEDVEEAGTITVDNPNPAVGTRVNFELSDPDGDIVTANPPLGFTWKIQFGAPGSWTDVHVTSNNNTSLDYRLPEDDDLVGLQLRAVVDPYTDRRGTGKSAESEATAAITADPIVNAPPRFTGAGTQNIPETAANENVGIALTAKDRDNDTLTWGLGDTAASDLFEINPSTGQLRTAQALDFETGAGRLFLNVTIADGKDANGNADPLDADVTSTVTITITDVEEPGVVTLSDDEPGVGVAVDATLSDGDGSISGEMWQWARSADGRTRWFSIVGATSSSYTTVPADADFYLRARASYTDNRGGGKDAAAVTALRVFGENQRPTFPSTENGQRMVAENTRAGVTIGAPMAAEDPEDDRLTYSLTGADAAAFTVVSSTGQLRTSEALDFEMQSSYSFTIGVHDGQDGLGNPSTLVDDTQAVTVTIENVEEPGTVTLSTLTGTFQARVEVTAALSDPDIPRGITWQWSRSPNGRTGWVNIATGDVYTPALVEVGSYLRATASYTDGHGPNNKEARQVSARLGAPPPINSAPAFPASENGQREAPEDAAVGDPIGEPVAATDVNAGDSSVNDPIAYSLSGTDAASFEIDLGSGQIRLASGVQLDYERKRTYRLTVRVTDGRDQSGDGDMDAIDDTINVTITVTDVNEAPGLSGDNAPSYQENSNSAVATYSASDPERDTITWTVDNDIDFWVSQRGQLYFRSPPSFEDRTNYQVTVVATDEDGLSDSIAVTVTVTDAEEAGSVAMSPPRGWVDQQTLFRAVLADDDGQIVGTTWQWARSTDRSRWLDIAGATQPTYTVGQGNVDEYNHYLRATASYSDRRGSNKTASGALPGRIGDLVPATNRAPEFAEASAERSIGQGTAAGRAIGAPVRAVDRDVEDILSYSLSGPDADDFSIDPSTGQLRTKAVLDFDSAGTNSYDVTVSVHDGFAANYAPSTNPDDSIDVTITVLEASPVITGVGGGGGGGGGGPSPSTVDFEWTVKHDIEELDAGHGSPTGLWSDGTTMWIAENGDGADDAIYAYDLTTGERVEDREFELAETNRAPRGVWSDRVTLWVSDSGQNRLFAHDLASGERVPDSDIELAERNRDARGIWSDGQTMWVLDDGKNALYAYDLASGELLAEYALDSANNDPHGLFFDGVTVWVSDDGEKRLFAYRLPMPDAVEPTEGEDEADEVEPLERVRDEEFGELSGASNNSPRGIWANGDFMYVVDASDGKVYTYNMPDDIDARLATLTLSGVDIGEFLPRRTDYEGDIAEGVTEATVEAATVQRRTSVAIAPPDADGNEANGHQVALEGVSEITVTVTSADGSRERVYRIAFTQALAEITLDTGWNTFAWPGAADAAIADALGGDGDLANDISAAVAALYGWDEEASAWLAFFPGLEDVPGLNTLTTLQQGSTYWVAVTEPLTWTVLR